MGARELMAELIGCGLSVHAQGDKLLISPRERLTPEIREAVTASKPELMALLRHLQDGKSNDATRATIADDAKKSSPSKESQRTQIASETTAIAPTHVGMELSRHQTVAPMPSQEDERPEPPPDLADSAESLQIVTRAAVRVLRGESDPAALLKWLRTRGADCDDRRLCVECGHFVERGTSCHHPHPVAIQAPRNLGRMAITPHRCDGFAERGRAYA